MTAFNVLKEALLEREDNHTERFNPTSSQLTIPVMETASSRKIFCDEIFVRENRRRDVQEVKLYAQNSDLLRLF